jgi:hypothetical protein
MLSATILQTGHISLAFIFRSFSFYEASLKVKGRIRDVLIDANGNVVEIE